MSSMVLLSRSGLQRIPYLSSRCPFAPRRPPFSSGGSRRKIPVRFPVWKLSSTSETQNNAWKHKRKQQTADQAEVKEIEPHDSFAEASKSVPKVEVCEELTKVVLLEEGVVCDVKKVEVHLQEEQREIVDSQQVVHVLHQEDNLRGESVADTPHAEPSHANTLRVKTTTNSETVEAAGKQDEALEQEQQQEQAKSKCKLGPSAHNNHTKTANATAEVEASKGRNDAESPSVVGERRKAQVEAVCCPKKEREGKEPEGVKRSKDGRHWPLTDLKNMATTESVGRNAKDKAELREQVMSEASEQAVKHKKESDGSEAVSVGPKEEESSSSSSSSFLMTKNLAHLGTHSPNFSLYFFKQQ